MSASLRPVFVLRHYNDVDNVIPVIVRWTEVMGPGAIALVATLQSQDIRLARLAEIPGLEIMGLEQFVAECQAIARQNGATESWQLADIFVSKLVPEGVRGAFLFDRNRLQLTVEVCLAARRRGFPTIAMPEGENPILGQLYLDDGTPIDINAPFSGLRPESRYEHFDYHVFSSRKVGELFLHFDESGERVYNGSARYCRQWLARINQFWPKLTTDLPNRANATRVVLFLRGPTVIANWREVAQTIRFLVKLPNIDLIVKYHSRENYAVQQCGLPAPDAIGERHPDTEIRYVDWEAPSLDLLNWGEIFLSMSTTVTFQAVLTGKPVLDLSFVLGYRPSLSEYFPRTDIRSRDELLHALIALIPASPTQRADLVYPAGELRRFVRDCIEPNGPNVLDYHIDFIRSAMIGDRRPTRSPQPPIPNYWGLRPADPIDNGGAD